MQASQKAADAEGAAGEAAQLQLQVASLQAAVKRLGEELAAAKEAAAASEAELSELLDANTLLESQVRHAIQRGARALSRTASCAALHGSLG